MDGPIVADSSTGQRNTTAGTAGQRMQSTPEAAVQCRVAAGGMAGRARKPVAARAHHRGRRIVAPGHREKAAAGRVNALGAGHRTAKAGRGAEEGTESMAAVEEWVRKRVGRRRLG